MTDGQVEWAIEWFVKGNGERPLRTFLAGLTGRNYDEAIALMEMLGKWGNRLGSPNSEALGDGLFELRGHQVRIFYMFRPGRRIILFDGIVKKKDRIPSSVLDVVRKYQQEVRAMDAKGKRGP